MSWARAKVEAYKTWVRANADDIMLTSAVASIVSGVGSTVSLLCPACTPVSETVSAIADLGALWADTSLAIAGRGDWHDVLLDGLSIVPGLGLWRADAKITEYAEKYYELDGRIKKARALKKLIGDWSGFKEAMKNLKYVEAVKDIAKGVHDLIDQFRPPNSPGFPNWQQPKLAFSDVSNG
ncbi:MAG TPA: hypothetical protein VGU71_21690 [Candidatus Dormibacteraeota bacterium]|nr:hypothetical protein [Candidatus Dormibacteraeota bacterium]